MHASVHADRIVISGKVKGAREGRVHVQKLSKKGVWKTVKKTRHRGVYTTKVPARGQYPQFRVRSIVKGAAITSTPATISILDVFEGIGDVYGLYDGLARCDTPAGCFSSDELAYEIENNEMLKAALEKLDNLQETLDKVDTEVKAGFLQLDIDIKNSDYQNAVTAVSGLLNDTREANRQLRTVFDPAKTTSARKRAFSNFVKYTSNKLDGNTLSMLRLVAGNPADPTSTTGVYPTAWALINSAVRSEQKLDVGAEVTYRPNTAVNLMTNIGVFYQLHQAEMAAVLGAYQFQDSDSAQDMADAVQDVIDEFVDPQDGEYQGVKEQQDALPAPLPNTTGVFTSPDASTVVGNFNRYAPESPTGRYIVHAPNAAPIAGVNVESIQRFGGQVATAWGPVTPLNPVPNYGTEVSVTDTGLIAGNFTTDGYPKCLAPTPNRNYVIAVECDWGNTPPAEMRWNFHPDTNTITNEGNGQEWCLEANTSTGRLNIELAGGLRLGECDNSVYQKWYFTQNAPAPMLTAAKLARARQTGSPEGDNPSGTGAWRTEWNVLTETVAYQLAQQVAQQSGTTIPKLGAVYGKYTDENMHVLPPTFPAETAATSLGVQAWTTCGKPYGQVDFSKKKGADGSTYCSTERPYTSLPAHGTYVATNLLTYVGASCDFVYVADPRTTKKC